MKKWTPLPPTYFTVALAAMAALHLLFPAGRWIAFPWRWLGLAPAGVGAVLNGVTSRQFDRRATTVKPFQRSEALLTDGAFRWSRNPMYLGMLLVLLGAGVLLGTAPPLVVPPLFVWAVTRRFIGPEERMLEERFGREFDEYRRRVRRWI
jgi:protein-S-isoprenylcysteine O-methyltransferase Ste14